MLMSVGHVIHCPLISKTQYFVRSASRIRENILKKNNTEQEMHGKQLENLRRNKFGVIVLE